jgi:hypothetical protein
VPVDVDLGDYVAGGYWVVWPMTRWEGYDGRFVADPIVSCSGCLLRGGAGPTKVVDGWYPFEETAGRLGVAADAVADAKSWVAERDDLVGETHTWSSPVPLVEFVERFIPDGSAMVLGVALPRQRERAWTGSPLDGGIEALLDGGASPATGGVPLGWEPVEVHPYAVMCSWTCNDLQPEVAERVELRLTGDGLLADQEHADEVMRIVAGLDKEPGPWEAFLLIRYGPEPRGPFRPPPEPEEIPPELLQSLELPSDLLDSDPDIPFQFPADIPWPPDEANER